MRLQFNEAKATQTAARLLKLRGGRMSYLKLIKLLYLVDRSALLGWGRPVTTDRFVAMEHGPVVSHIYNFVRDEPAPGMESIWHQYITPPSNYEVALRVDQPPSDELSRAEERLIDEVYHEFGRWDRWKLRDYCHDLPEWSDPSGSSRPIEYADILRAEGRPAAEIEDVSGDLTNVQFVESLGAR